MIRKLSFFETYGELTKLTGLNQKELKACWFKLDKRSWGFVSDKLLDKEDVESRKPDRRKCKPGYFLLQNAVDYLNGSQHIKCDGKHYYICAERNNKLEEKLL